MLVAPHLSSLLGLKLEFALGRRWTPQSAFWLRRAPAALEQPAPSPGRPSRLCRALAEKIDTQRLATRAHADGHALEGR